MVAGVFSFPTYFGMNWDALDECLADLEWLSASGHILGVRNAEALFREQPTAAARLISSWLFASSAHRRTETPFHMFLSWSD